MNMYLSVLNVIGLQLILISIHAFLLIKEKLEVKKLAIVILASCLLVISHSYDIIPLILILLCLAIYDYIATRSLIKLRVWLSAIIGITPAIIFVLMSLTANPTLAVWAGQAPI